MERFASDPHICRQCRGLCCQGHPGIYANPERFRRIILEKWPADPAIWRQLLPLRGLELRNLAGVPVPAPRPAPWGCAFLGNRGCRLGHGRRPEQCLALIPSVDTLTEGEIRCELPAQYRTGAVRNRWLNFWKSATARKSTGMNAFDPAFSRRGFTSIHGRQRSTGV